MPTFALVGAVGQVRRPDGEALPLLLGRAGCIVLTGSFRSHGGWQSAGVPQMVVSGGVHWPRMTESFAEVQRLAGGGTSNTSRSPQSRPCHGTREFGRKRRGRLVSGIESVYRAILWACDWRRWRVRANDAQAGCGDALSAAISRAPLSPASVTASSPSPHVSKLGNEPAR
jgi:hypothetical protein